MKKWMPLIIFIILIGAAVTAIVTHKEKPGKYDEFAQCIANSGTIFYGAFWCPHCAATKALFGSSAKYLPYTECSTPDGKSQLQVCTDADVSGYPTWVFPDQSRLSGEQTLETLAQKTNCPLPQ
jgi:hypothetical protein